MQQAGNEEAELAAVLAASMVQQSPVDDDAELAAALAASLATPAPLGPSAEEDAEMAAVLAASLAAAEEQRKIDENIARLMGLSSAPAAAADISDALSPSDAPVIPPPDANEPDTCPLCMEDLDETDKLFIPCPCGFQLCVFCYRKIKEQESGEPGAGLCPGCRKEFGDPVYKERPSKGSKQPESRQPESRPAGKPTGKPEGRSKAPPPRQQSGGGKQGGKRRG